MSRLITIPVNVKFGSNVRQLNLALYLSNELFERFQTSDMYENPNEPRVENFSQHANEWLGEEVFSLNYPLYSQIRSTDVIAQKIEDVISMSGNNVYRIIDDNAITEITAANGFSFTGMSGVGIGTYVSQTKITFNNIFKGYDGNEQINYAIAQYDEDRKRGSFGASVIVLPEDIFDSETGKIDYTKYPINTDLPIVGYTFTAQYNSEYTYWEPFVYYRVYGIHAGMSVGKLRDVFGTPPDDFSIKNSGANESDPNNPYTGEEGNSNPGGGDGTLPGGGLDFTDPTDFPDLPLVTSAAAGFISIYTPSITELKNLANFLWSGAFDLDTFKKLFTDPMEAIIGLGVVPAVPASSGTKSVQFGNVNSEVAMSYVDTQFVKVNCGSLKLDKYIGSFMDYSPYTKISIYLPYIGMRDLSPDDLIGGSIEVQYSIDILTGACACFIKHSSRGVLYSYNGSCIANIPLTGQSYSAAIQNAVSAVISGVGMVAGMATGAAPVTAMSAAGLINSAANTALNSKPTIQRSGNMGGSAGILSVQKPYVIIERPRLSVPSKVQNYVGQCANMTMNLGACSGYTIVEFCHIEGVPCTTEELTEIESLLKGGVIL